MHFTTRFEWLPAIPLAFMLVLPLVVAPSSTASALVFDSPIAYSENFEAEVGFPTTAEFDAFGAGGVQDRAESGPPPTLTGTAVRETASDADFEDGVVVEIDHEVISTLASEVGVRAEMSGFGFSGEGTARFVLAMQFALDDELALAGTSVGVIFEVRRLETSLFAQLRFFEEHVGPSKPEFLNLTEVFVDPAILAELEAGAPFTLDVQVDRASAIARASVLVGSQPELLATPIALALAHDYSLTRVIQFLSLLFTNQHEVEVDLDRIQIFAEPHTFEPLLNLDVGSFWSVPDPSYGAAGSPGVWNEIAMGAASLVDLSGNSTGMTATLTADSLGEVMMSGGDVRNLMSDWAADPSGWSLYVDGLTSPGGYRVTYYATAAGTAETGILSTNGLLAPSVPGVGGIPFPVTVEGLTYQRVEAIVDGSDLDMFSDSVGGETQLSGVQIDRTVVVPESGFGVGTAVGGILVLAFGSGSLAGRRCRRGRHGGRLSPL